MTQEQETILSYRIERAHETLHAAQILADAGHWSACVNRLYYACFYAVSALLLSRGLASSKHTGVRGLFNRHFVKTAKVPRRLGALYNDLFENRQKGDYMDLVRFEEAKVRTWITQAEDFVKGITALAFEELSKSSREG